MTDETAARHGLPDDVAGPPAGVEAVVGARLAGA
jgi:hypothetical protein